MTQSCGGFPRDDVPQKFQCDRWSRRSFAKDAHLQVKGD
jgi:hypothetical protein